MKIIRKVQSELNTTQQRLSAVEDAVVELHDGDSTTIDKAREHIASTIASLNKADKLLAKYGGELPPSPLGPLGGLG
jgi:hypothetical protein